MRGVKPRVTPAECYVTHNTLQVKADAGCYASRGGAIGGNIPCEAEVGWDLLKCDFPVELTIERERT